MTPKIPFKIRLKWIFDKSNRSGFISRLRVLFGGYTPTLISYFITEDLIKDFQEIEFAIKALEAYKEVENGEQGSN